VTRELYTVGHPPEATLRITLVCWRANKKIFGTVANASVVWFFFLCCGSHKDVKVDLGLVKVILPYAKRIQG